MRLLVILGLTMVVATTACAESPPPPSTSDQQSAAAVRREIERINADLERWYAEGAIDSIAARFTDDAWQMGPNMPPVVGRDSIAANWRRAVQWGQWIFSLRAEDVVVEGSLATERGTYTTEFRRSPNAPAAAPPSFTDRGNYVVAWVNDGAGWRIRWDIATSELPPESSGQ